MKKSLKLNAVLNIIKQLCAVVFPLITIPYVSRVLKADSYGKVSFGNSIVSYFALLAALGINDYAVREGAKIREDKEKIKKFVNEIFSINVMSTISSYVLLFVLLLYSKKLYDYRTLIVIQSASILLTTIGMDWINSIYEDYLYITVRYIIFQIISLICLFIFVREPNDYVKYAVVTVLASTGGNLLNIFYIRKYVTVRFTIEFNFKRHIKPIIYLFFNAVAVTIYVNSDMTILGILKAEKEVGIYGLSTKIYTVVKQILNAIVVVTLPRLSLYLGQNNLKAYGDLVEKIFNSLMSILLPTVIGLLVLSKQAIFIVGGVEYIEGYHSLQILCIALIFAVLSGFFCCCILLPYGQEKICLIASTAGAITNVLLNLYFIKKWSYNGAAVTTMLSEGIVVLIYWLSCRKYIKFRYEKKVMGYVALGCISIVIICYVIKKIVTNIIWQIILCIVGGVIAYLGVQICGRNPVVMQLYNKIVCLIKNK